MARITASALLLILFAEPALAQITFELPRECLERQVPDPRGCEIQDGPPHRVYPATRHLHKPAGSTPSQAATTSTPANTLSVPFKAPR
jgi:hypothetical protein